MDAKQWLQKLLLEGRSTSHLCNETETFNTKIDGELSQRLALDGKKFFKANFFSIFVSMLTGLLSLMYVKSGVSVLSFTKKSHKPILAFKRYLSTLRHSLRWYEDMEQMKASLKAVRLHHKDAAVRYGKAMGTGHIGISQYDMVVTQWGFIGPVLLFPEKLGISDYDETALDGMVHIMYLVGLELGVKDKYNLCHGGLDKARENSKEVFLHVIQPAFKNNMKDEECSSMATSLMTGMNILNPFIDPAAFQQFTLELFLVSSDSVALAGYSAVIKTTMDFVFHRLLHVPIVGEIVRVIGNSLMRLNIFLASDWQEFIVANWNSERVSIRDRIHVFVAIPVLPVVSGVCFAWRNLDGGNLLMVLGFYIVIYVMFNNLIIYK